jgi:hypothetical protein
MVIVPAHDLVLVRPHLFGNRVVRNQDAIVLLDLPHRRFDRQPQILRNVFRSDRKRVIWS